MSETIDILHEKISPSAQREDIGTYMILPVEEIHEPLHEKNKSVQTWEITENFEVAAVVGSDSTALAEGLKEAFVLGIKE